MLTIIQDRAEDTALRTAGDAAGTSAEPTPAPVDARAVDPAELDRLAWDVERAGLAGHEDDLARVVAVARPTGVSPVLLDVLADPTEAECARVRAFGRVALWLGSHPLAA